LERYLRLFKDLMEPGADLGATLKSIQELTDFVSVALSSPSTSAVLLYVLHHGAGSSWALQCDLNLPESTVYRALKRLRSAGLIVPALKAPKQSGTRGGPRPNIWSTEISKVEEIAAALRRHHKLLSPKFRVAEQISQAILDEFTEEQHREIRYPEIMVRVRALKIPFVGSDVADLAASYLHEQGVKVWR